MCKLIFLASSTPKCLFDQFQLRHSLGLVIACMWVLRRQVGCWSDGLRWPNGVVAACKRNISVLYKIFPLSSCLYSWKGRNNFLIRQIWRPYRNWVMIYGWYCSWKGWRRGGEAEQSRRELRNEHLVVFFSVIHGRMSVVCDNLVVSWKWEQFWACKVWENDL